MRFNGRELNNSSLKNILENSKYKKRRSAAASNHKEDEPNKSDDEKAPNFDCSGGLNLSDDSDDDDDDFDEVAPSQQAAAHHADAVNENSINENAANAAVDLKKVHDNYQKFERAKEKMKNYKKAATSGESQKENVDIAGLLAMGEQSNGRKKSSQKRVQRDESDSDEAWEDVEGKRIKVPKYRKILKTFEYEG